MVKPNSLSGRKKTGESRRAGKSPKASASRHRPRKPAPGADPVPAGDSERRILEAARKEFIAKGLDGARMQAIAAEAGVNKALLHYYHRSKERLYRTVVRDILHSVWGNIRAHFDAHGPGDGLEPMARTLVSTYIRTLAANPEFPLFMIREMGSGGEAFRAVLEEADLPIGEVPRRLMEALKAGIAAGEVKPVNPLHFFMNLLGMSLATFLARPALERLGPAVGMDVRFDGAFLEERISSIVDMAMNGVRTRRKA